MTPADFTRLLNLGCGPRHHPAWTNVDVAPTSPGVLAHDLKRRLPFADEAFDAVYASHVLEHLPREAAPAFLDECRRVLRPGGVLRLVVPDLETIASLYLEALHKVREGDSAWQANYDWMTIELLDQLVRHRPGGEMKAFLSRPDLPNAEFVIGRLGAEARQIIDAARQRAKTPALESPSLRSRFGERLRRVRSGVRNRRRSLAAVLSGPDREALQVGRFRLGGEVHLWMYDAYSLARLLARAGFPEARRVDAHESAIPDWTRYQLDVELDGRVRKPDSLFMETVR